VTDQSNTVRWRWMSEPFGTDLPNEDPAGLGTFAMPLRFPGQYADSNTGPFYNYFRDYDPWAGRYLQFDPIGLEGGSNGYQYVESNPLSFTDPRGLSIGSTGFARPHRPITPNLNPQIKAPPCTCRASGSMSAATAGNTIAGSMAVFGGGGAVTGGVVGTSIGVAEATHLGIVGGVAVADAAGTGAMAGGMIGAAVGAVVGVAIVAIVNMCAPEKCPCGTP